MVKPYRLFIVFFLIGFEGGGGGGKDCADNRMTRVKENKRKIGLQK